VPDKIIIPDINDGVAKGEVKRSALSRVKTINHIQICTSNILRRRECGHERFENCRGQGAERVSAVEEHGLALSPRRCLVDVNDFAAGLVNGNSVQVDPESCPAIGRLLGRDDRALHELASILLGIDAAKNDGSCPIGNPLGYEIRYVAKCVTLETYLLHYRSPLNPYQRHDFG
jgi:hypothetical protein